MPKIVDPAPSLRGGIRPLVATSIAIVLGASAYLACTREVPPTAPETPAQASTVPGAASSPESDPLKMWVDNAPPAPVKFSLPELPFEDHSAGLPTSGTWRGYPLLFDFTADKRADLVVSNREEDGYNAWESAEKGPWIRRIEGLSRDMAYGPARAADMNSDGIPDLLVSSHSDALRLYVNDGTMNWKRSETVDRSPNLMIDIAVGNLNGDAFPDVAGIAHFGGGISVFLGDGHGGLKLVRESTNILTAMQPVYGNAIELADIDGDGIDDIVSATVLGAKVLLTRPGPPMSWEDNSAGLPAPAIMNSINSVKVGRFVPGGRPQIATCLLADPLLVGDKRDSIGVYAWNAETKVWEHIDHGLPRNEFYKDLAVADFNHDGNLDLVVMSLDSGGVIYLGDGHGGFTAKGRLSGVHGFGRVTIGDIDGDGWPDIVVSVPGAKDHPEGGGLRAFLNRPAIWK